MTAPRGVDVGWRLVLAGELIEGRAAEEAEIGRNERQHARREEAQQPSEQRSEIGDVHACAPASCPEAPTAVVRETGLTSMVTNRFSLIAVFLEKIVMECCNGLYEGGRAPSPTTTKGAQKAG